MSAYTDRLRETALAECHHGADELCEHRSAALAYELVERPRVGFELGALLAWMALGLAFTLLAVLLSINVVGWLLDGWLA